MSQKGKETTTQRKKENVTYEELQFSLEISQDVGETSHLQSLLVSAKFYATSLRISLPNHLSKAILICQWFSSTATHTLVERFLGFVTWNVPFFLWLLWSPIVYEYCASVPSKTSGTPVEMIVYSMLVFYKITKCLKLHSVSNDEYWRMLPSNKSNNYFILNYENRLYHIRIEHFPEIYDWSRLLLSYLRCEKVKDHRKSFSMIYNDLL